MKKFFPHLTRTFLAGLLAVLPLVATVALLVFALNLIVQGLGPKSFMGQVLISIGVNVTGSEILGYAIGMALLLLAILFLGFLVERGLQRGFTAMVNALVSRIPVVRSVYDTIRRFVDLVAKKDDNSMGTMRPVWCTFGGSSGQGGATVLGLLSAPDPVMVGGTACYAVLIPTAPVPVGGGLLYVPTEWVKPADIGMEALTSIYVSMGVTSAQHMPLARPKQP